MKSVEIPLLARLTVEMIVDIRQEEAEIKEVTKGGAPNQNQWQKVLYHRQLFKENHKKCR